MRTAYAHTIHAHTYLECPMLHFNNAPKRAANLSLNSKVLETAKDLGMNISQTVDTLLAR